MLDWSPATLPAKVQSMLPKIIMLEDELAAYSQSFKGLLYNIVSDVFRVILLYF